MNITTNQRVGVEARDRILAVISRDVDIFVSFNTLFPVAQQTEPLRLDPRNRLWERINT